LSFSVVKNISGLSPHQIATASNLALIHTEVGFDLLIDRSDYISVLLGRDGLFEFPETELAGRIVRTNDTCIDAGCQIGYYSCLFAKLVGEKGRVYSFDANPQACKSTRRNLALNGFYSTEVVHAALADCNGIVPFHISNDDQTGLSSLGLIPVSKETISVPSLRLEGFLRERRVDRVRLLKIDVEGSEEIVLKGLGHFLDDHIIDYILVECFDERLRLLNSSTEAVADVLSSAGYTAWEYRMDNGCTWSQTAEVSSRGDCNYLFKSPAVGNDIPTFSLSGALNGLFQRRNELSIERDKLCLENASLRESVDSLQHDRDKLHDDLDWLLSSIKAHEEQSAVLAAAKRDLETVLSQIQGSASWRTLNKWRKLRNSLAPENSWHRRLYDSVLGNFRKKN
jgi:FkbM family methyltransferase